MRKFSRGQRVPTIPSRYEKVVRKGNGVIFPTSHKGNVLYMEAVMANFEQRQIVAGPSREELFDALRLRHEDRKVTFTVAPTEHQRTGGGGFRPGNLAFQANVMQITASSGNDGIWYFKLYDRHASMGSEMLEGHIDITKREGAVKPIPSERPNTIPHSNAYAPTRRG